MSATITVTGLGSGIDLSQIVDQLVQLERYQIDRLEIWKDEWEDKIESIQGLNSRLLSLESFANDYNTETEFLATTATSSDEDVLTVTSTSTAIAGAHSITIGNNIPHRLATQGISDKTAAVGVIAGINYNQDLVINVGSDTITVNFVAPDANEDGGQFDLNTTLEELVTTINAADTNDYLTASIIEDGSSDNKYRLVLTTDPLNGGDDRRISVTSNPLNLNFNESNISNTVENDWAGAAVTSHGTSTADQNKTYTFTASADGTVGQVASLEIAWIDGVGGSGSVQVGSNYIAGDLLTVADGLQVSFAAGNINNAQVFKINVWNNVDSVEEITWDASSADPLKAGYYTGSSNKIFQFKVLSSGTLGTNEIGLYWDDSEGNSGTITIPSTYVDEDELAVYQGVKVKFDTTTNQALVANDTFSMNVFHPTLQAGQDSGLAQVEQVVHSGFADEDTTAVTGSAQTFSYTYAGVAVSAIDVAADTTLSGLVGLINNDSDNPGVTASILNDGLGLSTSYHLVLTGRDTGAAYTITNITGFTNFSSSDFTTTQEAQNSMLKVDGYPSDTYQYIQRQSNSVSDVIDGVTLSLVDSGSVSVSITKDLDTIRTNIETFVNGVNFLLDYIKKETGYDEDTGEAGAMVGNYSYQIVQARINQILTNAIPGLTDGVDTYVHLAQIGIKTNPDEDGKWEIDSTTLNNALLTDLEAISKLFIKDDVAGTNGVYELLSQELEDLTDSEDGPMNVLVEHYEDIIDGIDTRVEREERRIALVEGRLTDQFVALEVLLGQLSGQESYLLSLIESLPTIGGKKD